MGQNIQEWTENFFKVFLPQNLLGPFLINWSHMLIDVECLGVFWVTCDGKYWRLGKIHCQISTESVSVRFQPFFREARHGC